jgi:hypothetical protein
MTFAPRYPKPLPRRPWEEALYRRYHKNPRRWAPIIRALQRVPLLRRLFNRIYLCDLSDYLYPIIRATFPTNPINDLVSVEPITRPGPSAVQWRYAHDMDKAVSAVLSQPLTDEEAQRRADQAVQDVDDDFRAPPEATGTPT